MFNNCEKRKQIYSFKAEEYSLMSFLSPSIIGIHIITSMLRFIALRWVRSNNFKENLGIQNILIHQKAASYVNSHLFTYAISVNVWDNMASLRYKISSAAIWLVRNVVIVNGNTFQLELYSETNRLRLECCVARNALTVKELSIFFVQSCRS